MTAEDKKAEPTSGVVASIPGPVTDRRCTDVFFLLLFILFWVGMIVVASIGLSEGDPRRLYMPSDVYGNFCGMDNTKLANGLVYDFDTALQNQTNCNSQTVTDLQKKNCDMRIDMTHYKYLVFVNPTSGTKYGGFCASQCPYQDSGKNIWCPDPVLAGYSTKRGRATIVQDTSQATSSRCFYRRYSFWQASSTPMTESSYPLTSSSSGYTPSVSNGDYYIESNSLVGVVKSSSFVYRCVPSSTLDAAGSKASAAVRDTWGQLWGDVARSWRIFLVCTAVAFAAGFVWIFLMKILAGPMVWLSIFLVFCLLVFVGYWFSSQAQKKRDEQPSDSDSQSTQALQYTGYAFYGLAFIYFCMIVFLRKRINLAIAIVKEASSAIQAMPMLVITPIIMAVFVIGFLAYWIAVACYIMSIYSPTVTYVTVNDKYQRPGEVDWSFNYDMRYVLAYHFFGLLWTMGFLLSTLFIMIATACATWYFIEQPKQAMPRFPVSNAAGVVLRYHLGTVAFGSLIIAIIQFLRACILYFEKKIRALTKDTPCQSCVTCLLCYCNCCMAYVQRFMEFISKNAYIQTAINGFGFCKAARAAWKIITANAVRVGTVNFVADFLCFTGKLMIVLGNCCLALYFTQQDSMIEGGDATQLNSPTLIVLIVFIGTWFIAQLFMHVYESAIVTLLQCFLIDEQDYQGRFASPNLRKFVEEDDLKPKAKKEEGSKKE
jgi:hypothetical protein